VTGIGGDPGGSRRTRRISSAVRAGHQPGQACPPGRLQSLRGRRPNQAAGLLLPEAADPFFVTGRVDSNAGRDLSLSYSVLIMTDGTGALRTAKLTMSIRRGSIVLIPFAAGACARASDVRCLPAP